MKKRPFIFILFFILLLVALVILNSQCCLSFLLSAYFSKELNAKVSIEEASLNFKGTIKANSINITNKKGLNCSIEKAMIDYDPASIIKHGLSYDLRLKGVKLSYPESGIINGIAGILSIKPLDLFTFDDVEGTFYNKKDELIIKGLSASGALLKIFADATIVEDSRIDATFRILLAERLIANIPEATRKVFFKQDQPWSEVKFYITGDMEKPSINFSTDLFKLTVH